MFTIYQRFRTGLAYLFFGGLTTLVNIAVYLGLAHGLRLPYLAANVTAWVVSVLFAYATNRAYVFASRQRGWGNILKECGAFIGCRLLSSGADTAIMYVMIDLLGLGDLTVKIFANLVVIIMNYVISRDLIFKDRRRGVVTS
ncbi:MAG: GtrA family protein [Syntrophomonadaceae bacterium]